MIRFEGEVCDLLKLVGREEPPQTDPSGTVTVSLEWISSLCAAVTGNKIAAITEPPR